MSARRFPGTSIQIAARNARTTSPQAAQRIDSAGVGRWYSRRQWLASNIHSSRLLRLVEDVEKRRHAEDGKQINQRPQKRHRRNHVIQDTRNGLD